MVALMVFFAGEGAEVRAGALSPRTSLDFFDLMPSKPQTLDLVFSFLIAFVTGGSETLGI
jgi:hypothetical protein